MLPEPERSLYLYKLRSIAIISLHSSHITVDKRPNTVARYCLSGRLYMFRSPDQDPQSNMYTEVDRQVSLGRVSVNNQSVNSQLFDL